MHDKIIICANWKLNHNVSETLSFIKKTKEHFKNRDTVQIIIAPVITTLFAACNAVEDLKHREIIISAQNVHFAEKGAYTGEYSAEHLIELGCNTSIVGHSERRLTLGDTDDLISKKLETCLRKQITPILCIGENIDQKREGATKETLKKQITSAFSKITDSAKIEKTIIAYEPVWAIGTGQNASPIQIEDTHFFIKEFIKKTYLNKLNKDVRVIYGGSVNEKNAKSIIMKSSVDGALIGGASLNPDTFIEIANLF